MLQLTQEQMYAEFIRLREYVANCTLNIPKGTIFFRPKETKFFISEFFNIVPAEFRNEYSNCHRCLDLLRDFGNVFYYGGPENLYAPIPLLFPVETGTLWDPFIKIYKARLSRNKYTVDPNNGLESDHIVITPISFFKTIVGKDVTESGHKHLYVNVPPEQIGANIIGGIMNNELLIKANTFITVFPYSDIKAFAVALCDDKYRPESWYLGDLELMVDIAHTATVITKRSLLGMLAYRITRSTSLIGNPNILDALMVGVAMFKETQSVDDSHSAVMDRLYPVIIDV